MIGFFYFEEGVIISIVLGSLFFERWESFFLVFFFIRIREKKKKGRRKRKKIYIYIRL